MAIKRIITKAEFDKLSADLKKEYKAEEGGENYTLDLEGYEDPAALKRAKDHEKEQRKAAEKTAKDLQDQLAALTEERDGLLKGAIPKADVEKLENSYKSKFTAREKELNAQIEAANGSLQRLLVDNVAQTLATKISKSPTVIMPHIKSRLRAEKNTAGQYETKVVDKDGNISALTVEDLEKEFIDNKDFAPIITASRGSGGGAGGSNGGGGAAPKSLKDFKSATEEAQFANQNPAEYQRLVEAAKPA